ncbi:MAG: hypothetical protein J6U01_05440 [Clostridia bacterium]|nr:hypothetical protein [Clostridia bacterium]
MKKLFAVVLILAVLLPFSALADLPDISNLSTDELLELNHQIQSRLFSQKLVDGVDVPAGDYIVGEDIPAGVYRLVVVFPKSGGTLRVYPSKDEHYTLDSFLGEFWGVTELGKVALEDGNIVHITGNTLRFFPYTGLFN